MSQVIAILIATSFGIGRARFAPGTVASLAALPFAFAMAHFAGPLILAAAALAAYAAGIWATGVYARLVGKDDPGECVIDEVAGQWLACALSPLTFAGYALAFILFRAFDVAKPWPISRAEKLPGGFGVMTDDLLAGLIAGSIVALVANAGII
jgi:phosphatidylglycerophosphatase A